MRKLLFVSYHFPPELTSESLRALAPVKYLPRFGWEPVVLTVVRRPIAREDNSLVSELPKKIQIHRAFSSTNRFSNFALKKIGSILRWGYLTSYEIEWVPSAILKGKRLLDKEAIEVILSRSTPFASHLVALELKSHSGIPWVADFSDPWTQNPYLGKAKALDEGLERKVVSAADKIIFTNKFAKKQFLNKHRDMKEDKVVVIPNQYIPEDFEKQESVARSEVFTVVHTGSFHGIRSPETFFKALRMLIDQEGFDEKIKVKLIGTFDHEFKRLILKHGLGNVVEVMDAIPHRDVLRYLRAADVLLLIDAPTVGPSPFMPLKLAEYVRVGKPILAITPLDGASGDVVRSTKTGVVVSPNDVTGIKDEIKRLYQQYKKSELEIRPRWNEIENYSADRCTGILVNILEELTAQASKPKVNTETGTEPETTLNQG